MTFHTYPHAVAFWTLGCLMAGTLTTVLLGSAFINSVNALMTRGDFD